MKLIKGAIQAYPELYFAKLVVLGEGDSEELLLPKFFDLLGKEIDSSQISIVPLGGRHVNYFWKLLNSLRIPHITLLDFDNERYGGGWGRIKYVIQQLLEIGIERNDLVKLKDGRIMNDEDIAGISSWQIYDILSEPLLSWINHLEKFNIFFSAPLDIDFLMLQHYKDYYLNSLSPKEGPVVSYNDLDGSGKKVKLTDLDCLDGLQLEGLEKRIEEARRATLKDKSGPGESFTREEKELMIWYQYFFVGRGKPTTHMKFLSSISDDELKRTLPPVFEKIVKLAEELLGDVEYGEE